MTKMTLTINADHLHALAIVAVDPKQWIETAIEARAVTAIADLKADPSWVQALVEVAKTGGNYQDDLVVFAKGLELGLFLTAAQRDAEVRAGKESPAA